MLIFFIAGTILHFYKKKSLKILIRILFFLVTNIFITFCSMVEINKN